MAKFDITYWPIAERYEMNGRTQVATLPLQGKRLKTFEAKTVSACEETLAAEAESFAAAGIPAEVFCSHRDGRKPNGFDRARLRVRVNLDKAPVATYG